MVTLSLLYPPTGERRGKGRRQVLQPQKGIEYAARKLGVRVAFVGLRVARAHGSAMLNRKSKRRIEMKVFRVTVAGALLLVAVTAAFGMSVKSDYEKSFDFRQLHTFAFKTDRAGDDPLGTNTLEAGRIQNALAAQLEANGFSQAPQNPDFIVAFYSRTKQKTQVQSAGFGPGFGFGRGFGWGYGVPYRARWRWGLGPDIWTTTYTQGCVMADVIDPRTNDLVWRGVVKDTVNGIGQSEKQANQAARDLVKQLLKDAGKVEKKRG
jgi:uncharacterized membrane protein